MKESMTEERRNRENNVGAVMINKELKSREETIKDMMEKEVDPNNLVRYREELKDKTLDHREQTLFEMRACGENKNMEKMTPYKDFVAYFELNERNNF
jgi:hypothetical protein